MGWLQGIGMTFLTDTEKRKIADAIETAERKSTGELVTVVARAADSYRYIPLLWPALFALVLPGLLLIVAPGLAVFEVYAAQVGLFVILALILLVPQARMAVIPKSVKHRRARRLAREQFVAQGLHLTRDRTGVLIFVSVAERYVEIIADTGINAKVPPESWDQMVTDFVAQVRARHIADGFLAVVNATGDLLAEHFPRPDEYLDELPNHMIEI